MGAIRAILLMIGCVLVWPVAATPTRDAELHFFQASFGDLKEELGLARAEGRRGLFLMFSAEYCTPCIVMKKTVMNQVPVQDHFRRHFRVLQVDYNGDARWPMWTAGRCEARTMRRRSRGCAAHRP